MGWERLTVAAEGKTIDALGQFELIPVFGHVGRAVGFTQSSLHMLFAVGLIIALVGFEVLVALLQAYVFAILTTIYLHDAVHLH